MTRRDELIVGLDIGTTKICAVVAEARGDSLDIIGLGTHPSRGLHKGVVIDIGATVDSIRKAVDEAELMARLEQSNPELNLLKAEIKTAEVRQQLARREVVPDFAIGVQTIETGSAIMPGTRGSGDDPWMLTLSVDLPLWFSKYRADRNSVV